MRCIECGREKNIVAKGLCSRCYSRMKRKENSAICKGCKKFKPIHAKGFCNNCYANFKRHGDPLWKRKKKGDISCSYCGKHPMHAKGLCKSCYGRYRATGSPELKRRVYICKIEGCNEPVVFRGCCEAHKDKAIDNRKVMNSHFLKKYNITIDEYENMHEQQNGVCAICGQPENRAYNGNAINLAVDHCHKTGKVRGLLCSRCNQALGNFQDSSKILAKALNYLLNT